jgi:hypothetical protein
VASFMSPCFRRTHLPSFKSMAGMISMELSELRSRVWSEEWATEKPDQWVICRKSAAETLA